MKWPLKQVTLPLMIGISLTGLSIGVLYFLYKKDRKDTKVARSIQQKPSKIIEMNVPKRFVPVIIGRGGGTIKEIEYKTSTRINFDDDDVEKQYRICCIRGSLEGVRLAEGLIQAVIANQPVIENYEMQVSQRFCSCLLSNRGQVINEIQSSTNSKIIIEKGYFHDLDAKRRVIIKGTAEQIAAALSQIEDRLRDFNSINEKMALGQSLRSPRGNASFRSTIVTTSQSSTTSAEIAPIPEGTKEVYVSATESPGQFWVQVVGPGILALDELVKIMTEYYSDNEHQEVHKLTNITIGQTVAAKFSFDNCWYRAEIKSLISNGRYEVYFVDYGDHEIINESQLLELRTDFLSLRFQAMVSSLANVKSKDEDWSREACERFDELVYCAQWKPLIAKVRGFRERALGQACSRKESSPVLCVDLFDKNNNQELNIGKQLVIENMATAEEGNWSASSTLLLCKHNDDNSTIATRIDAAASEIKTPKPLRARVFEEIDLATPIKLPVEIEEIDLVTPVKDNTTKMINVRSDSEIHMNENGNISHDEIQYHKNGVPQWKVKTEPIPGGYEDDYARESDELEMF